MASFRRTAGIVIGAGLLATAVSAQDSKAPPPPAPQQGQPPAATTPPAAGAAGQGVSPPTPLTNEPRGSNTPAPSKPISQVLPAAPMVRT